MTRLPLTFECETMQLAATLDSAPGSTGLLLVSGGNEIRAGAFNGQAALAADIARAGFPVFRFDRRGIGDSEGPNLGFRRSRKDIEAALLAFRAIAPQMSRVVGFGNCDAASALMLASGAGCDALVLSNPWTSDDDTEINHTPSALRARYTSKLKDPRELARLMRGGVNLRKLARGLSRVAKVRNDRSQLVDQMRLGLDKFTGRVRFLIATNDRTGQLFLDQWIEDEERIAKCPDASHAYVEPEARVWLRTQILEVLRR